MKVREATLDVGDRVLIRQVAFRGRHKIADRWVKDPYVVIGIPIPGIPVFEVQKESDYSDVKTLHRNLLLPFSAIPKVSQVEDLTPPKPVKSQRTKPGKATPKPVTQEPDSDDTSDSESEEVIIPLSGYTPSHRRPSVVPDVSGDTNVSRSYSSRNQSDRSAGDNSISNITIRSSPDSSINTRGLSSTNVQSPYASDTSTLNSTAGISNARTPPNVPPPPRRSARDRQQPVRYGEWVYQQSADDPDFIEHFV